MRLRGVLPRADLILRPPGGFAATVLLYAVLTAALAPFLNDSQILDVALLYLLATLVVAAVWGYCVGLAGALLADLTVNFFFVPPLHTFTVQDPENVAALLIFLTVALVGASMLSLLRRQVQITAARAEETAILLSLSREVALAVSPRDALDRVCSSVVRALHAQGCAIVRPGPRWQVVGSSGGLNELPRQEEAVAAEALRTNAIGRLGGNPARRRAARRVEGGEAPIAFVPFGLASKERGALRVSGSLSAPPFMDLERLLRAFADEAGLAMSRALLEEEASRAEALQQADEFKSLLLSSVSHDLRTPLTAIKTAVESLRDDSVGWSEEDRASFLATIEGQTDRLAAMVSNLLEMSRLEGGAIQPTIEPVEVDALLSEVKVSTSEVTAGRDVTLEAPCDLWLKADYGLLVQSLVNLVENAARYSSPGGAIHLIGQPAGQRVALTVVDSGPPIPAGDVPHLFEKFYRGEQAGKSRGSGLGLAIVKATVELCGGSVRIQASRDGNAFTIELPRSPVPPR